MPIPGRNDPCPCGSGKKYKKCCLAKDRAAQAEAARPSPVTAPAKRALAWLDERYPEEMAEAVDLYFSTLGDDAPERIRGLPTEYLQMIEINVHEWLLADGDFDLGARDVPVRDLLLGPGGPLFAAEERAWMEAFLARPLGLYEVVDVTRGEGVRVQDLYHPDEPPVEVRDRSASRSLARWEVLGARLVPWEDHWLLSGAIYPFVRRGDFPDRLRRMRAELARETESDPELERAYLSVVIPREWMLELLESLERKTPDLVDAASGDPILLVTDHYRVRDWHRLEEALAGESDVDGSRRDGWVRFEKLAEDSRRSLLGINPGRGDRLQTFAQTLRRADEGRRWLEALAGEAIQHRTREMTDPRGSMAASGGRRSTGPHPGRAPRRDEIPMTTELMQQVLETQYRDWADEKIPALGGKTPRQAVRTPDGRENVIGLLKLYESGEERTAREQNRSPASLQFLWNAVGLDREQALS